MSPLPTVRPVVRFAGAASAIAAFVLGLPSAAAGVTTPPPADGPRRTYTRAVDHAFEVGATDVAAGAGATPGGAEAARQGIVNDEYRRLEACGAISAEEGYRWPCPDSPAVDHSDVCGTAPVLLPLWHRGRASQFAAWSDWELVEELSCVGQGPTPEQVLTEFRRLPITPSALTVQPEGPVLVNIDTIAYVDPAPQTLTTTVLGTPIAFQVTAATYTWDFGEDDPFTTTSPGHPWPDQDVAHPYRRPGTGQVTVTTTWQATYTLGTDPTVRTVPGTATTTTTSEPFEIVEAHSHLVANP